MEHTKADIRKLISKGKLQESNQAALEYAEYCGLTEIINGLTILSSRIAEHQKNWTSGILSYENYSLAHAQLSNDLLAWIDRLPGHPVPASKKRKLLSERLFKKRIFYLLIFVKVIVLLRLLRHWSTGGFTVDQLQATATLLIPAFAAYITVILGAYLKEQKTGIQPVKYITGPLVTFAYWLFPLYAIVLIILLELKAGSTLSFQQMNFWMAMVESVLGGYIGQIVYSFFRKEE